ncbi:slc38a6 [Symbiodinium natans]|uniref:Slc38a6 protein n=1 Tax=Symbiodinium natans TaxID=878477 RepID=A0A812PLK9_9DINO|nr:slc38a6 [Symbiodinium natans]
MVPRPPESQALPDLDIRVETKPLARRSVSSLASSIDAELLRGVSLGLVLAGCGRQWANRDADDYHLSHRVTTLDVFLSHDWGTKRWLKTLTLLVHFNSVPAAVASLVMCILVSVLIILRLLEGWAGGVLAIHATYWFVFLFWQNIRGLYRKQVVFLDRLCIAQHDADLKKQGILGLGGFLAKSQKLLVLWSPQYFTRLWTAFELSAFLRQDQARAKDIAFAPASMGPLLFYFCCFETLLMTSFHLLMVQYVQGGMMEQDGLSNPRDNLSLLMLAMLITCAPAFFVIAPVVLYLGTMQMRALLQLRKQLDDFSIRESKCSCCEMHHCHPETGEEILCDRMLVFDTLKRWYPDEESTESHLDKFDEMVHTKLGGFVRNILGSGAPHLLHIVAMTAHPLLGFLCHYVYLASNDVFGWTAHGWMIGWLQAPPMVYLAFWEMLQCWRMGARFGDRCPLWLILFLGMTAGISFNAALWLQYNMFKYKFGYNFNWPVVGSLAFMWIVFIVPYVWEYARMGRKTESR